MELNFEVGREDGDVNRFAFSRRQALRANLVQLHVAVVSGNEFGDDRVHGQYSSPALAVNESLKDLRKFLLCFS